MKSFDYMGSAVMESAEAARKMEADLAAVCCIAHVTAVPIDILKALTHWSECQTQGIEIAHIATSSLVQDSCTWLHSLNKGLNNLMHLLPAGVDAPAGHIPHADEEE